MRIAIRRWCFGLLMLVALAVAGCATGAGNAQGHAPEAAGKGGFAPSFTVSGAVGKPSTFDLAALQALPSTQQITGSGVYTGVSLWTLLESAAGGIKPGSGRNPLIAMYAVATGSDGYRTVLSIGEIDSALSGKMVLVAYSVDGKPLDRNGMARLVVTTDAKATRSVSNLTSIEVFALPPAR
ncbi:MAG: molybdopterin-dependent oxidoreductase [Variovorax sp.]|nr:molybdopterin-dependent oxidoreductase [Variovorax sp.]